MKKILFILPSLKRGGAEIQTVHLANGFSRKDFQVSVVSLQGEGCLSADMEQGVRLFALTRSGRFDFACIKQLAGVIDREKPDVVFCAMQFAFFYAWAARKFSKQSPKLISSLHTTLTVGLKEELQDRLLYQYVLRTACANVFVCESQQRYWVEKYPSLKASSVFIYNGIDPEYFQPGRVAGEAEKLREKIGLPAVAVTIVSVAGFRKEKNHIGLLRAFAGLPEEARLILVGDGPLRTLIEDEARNLGVNDRVYFTGLMEDVRPALELADVMAMPSVAVETFSLAMLEGMAMKVVPVVSDIGGQKEAFIQGESGWSFPMGDQQALESMLRRCVEHKAILGIMGEKARERVVNIFSKQKMIDETVALVNRVLSV